jgi:hypothetical protein
MFGFLLAFEVEKMKYKAKESFSPLYRKGDIFIIIKRNTDKNLTPIEARRLKDGNVYGFREGELEEVEK